MFKFCPVLATIAVMTSTAPLFAQPPEKAVIWNLDNLESIGGHQVTVVGTPRVI